MTTRYIICSRFNSDIALSKEFGITDSLNETWIAYRIAIFNRYTRKSLESQTNQEFLSLLTCHPNSMEIIQKELQKYPPLPPNILFTCDKAKMIEAYVQNADQLYISNLDSDDMYSPKVVQFLHDHSMQPNRSVLIFKNGYVFNTNNGIISSYYSSSPPFYTEIFDVEDYLSRARYSPPVAHAYMEQFSHEAITQPLFIIILHDRNTFPRYRQHVPTVFQNQQTLSNWQAILKEYHLA